MSWVLFSYLGNNNECEKVALNLYIFCRNQTNQDLIVQHFREREFCVKIELSRMVLTNGLSGQNYFWIYLLLHKWIVEEYHKSCLIALEWLKDMTMLWETYPKSIDWRVGRPFGCNQEKLYKLDWMSPSFDFNKRDKWYL